MIDPETLEQIASAASALPGLDDAALAGLKQNWPKLRFALCNDDDMPARLPPAVRRDTFNLYLIGEGEHCISLTADPLRAIGVVPASIED